MQKRWKTTTYTHWIYWITNLGRFRDQFFLVKSPWNASWVESSVRYPNYSQVDSPIICWLNPPFFLSNIPSVTGCKSLGLHTHILSYYCIILYRILIHIWNISYMYCCHIPTLCSCCINYIPKIPKTRFNTNEILTVKQKWKATQPVLERENRQGKYCCWMTECC